MQMLRSLSPRRQGLHYTVQRWEQAGRISNEILIIYGGHMSELGLPRSVMSPKRSALDAGVLEMFLSRTRENNLCMKKKKVYP